MFLDYDIKNKILESLASSSSAVEMSFYAKFLNHVSDDELILMSLDEISNLLKRSWEFLSKPQKNISAIEVQVSQVTEFLILNDDRPFVVTTITALFKEKGIDIDLIIHPVLTVQRSKDGQLEDIFPYDKTKKHESFVYIKIKDVLAVETIEVLKNMLQLSFDDLYSVVDDWPQMRVLVQSLQVQSLENKAFLDWVSDRCFVFMAAWEIKGNDIQNRYGLAKSTVWKVKIERLILNSLKKQSDEIHIFKTAVTSTVYARLPLDVIVISNGDDSLVFMGIFTAHAYSQVVAHVPLIRKKCEQVLENSGFAPQWHDSKELVHVFESLPKDDLFHMSLDELFETSMSLLHLQKRQNLSMFLRQSESADLLTILVYIRKERFSQRTQKILENLLKEEIQGKHLATHVYLDDLPYVRFQILMALDLDHVYCFDVKGLEAMALQALKNWDDVFFEEYGKKDNTYFEKPYKKVFSPQTGIYDLNYLQSEDPISGYLFEKEEKTYLKIFHKHTPLNLSSIFPILEKMGIFVFSEALYNCTLDDQKIYLYVFEIKLLKGKISEGASQRCLLVIRNVLAQKYKNDSLNSLIFSANLEPRDNMILRAYIRFMQQIQPKYNILYAEETLVEYPSFAALFVQKFYDKFKNGKENCSELKSFLKSVSSAEHDRILTLFINLLENTVRTNYYQNNGSNEYISLKFDSKKINDLPKPSPWREIFVYSTFMEGVHLRGGKVARGGVRWSDRRADYRMEVLGLVKAQQIKNPVIVPTGAKGGFFIKTETLPTLEQGIEAYKIFVHGLLDITDNLIQGKIQKPKDVICYDEDDPYLVVAADKGTASFSDIANAISQEYNFWLGDAFASGGSEGYDHKKLAITSKGAWESVRHHFERKNLNMDTDVFTAVGIGDMSGDVFGNGMLLCPNIRLLAAFDHRDIFIDPAPDIKIGYAERKRLFDQPKSSWQDYDAQKLSKGGMIFSRKEKIISLTEEAKTLLNLEGESFTPDHVVNAILKANVDLLWFGGIGTYVKSLDETDQDVKDTVNNSIRVNGSEIRAKIIGEGANLGMTQKGRIEYALNGGALNTDATDNSAGVNCSDHEVNIKILFSSILEDKLISLDQRNELLKSMAQDVSEHVLQTNKDQPRSITKTENNGVETLPILEFMMKFLEDEGTLDTVLEALPTYQILQDRYQRKIGLTRPEISVLSSFFRIFLRPIFLNLKFLEDKRFDQTLLDYFPKALKEKYEGYILKHPLRKEIITTIVLNSVVNTLGLEKTFNLYMHYCSDMEKFLFVYETLEKRNLLDDQGLFLNLSTFSMHEIEAAKSYKDLPIDLAAFALRQNLEVKDFVQAYSCLRSQIIIAEKINTKSFTDLYTFQKLKQQFADVLMSLAWRKYKGENIVILMDHPFLKGIFSKQGISTLAEMVVLLDELRKI